MMSLGQQLAVRQRDFCHSEQTHQKEAAHKHQSQPLWDLAETV
jgi:hypothetical protein